MRLLHSADWHLGRVYHGVSLLAEQADVLHQFIDHAALHRPDAILLAGDIYDRAMPPADAVRLLDQTLTALVVDLEIPVIVIAGNHDGADRLAFGAQLLARAGLTVRGPALAEVTPVRLHDAHGPVAIFPLPYADPPTVRHALGDEALADHHAALAAQLAGIRAQVQPGERSVLVAHAFVRGAKESESERDLSVGGTGAVGAELFAGFDFVALGHLHRPQQIGQLPVQYAGSLLKYSFSELDQAKSATLIELGANGVVSTQRLPLRPRRDLRALGGTLADILAQGRIDPRNQDYVLARLTDEGGLLDAMARLRAVYPNALAIERVTLAGDAQAEAPRRDFRKVRVTELFGDFYREVTGKALDAAGEDALAAVVTDLARREVTA